MFFMLQSTHLFFFIILLTGLLTVSTDIQQKKIYNVHLALSTALGSIVICYASLIKHEIILSHLISGTTAFIIGWFLHRRNLWRGGDAKLFALYAFLMPPLGHGTALFSGTIRLFACSFIAGMIIIFPVFIKDIIINHRTIANDMLSPAKRQTMFEAIVRTIFISWIFFPFYHRITNPAIILTITYFIFSWGYNTKKFELLKMEYIELPIGIVFGFLMRLWLYPNSLSCQALTRFIIMITLFTAISTCIQIALNLLKEYRDRVPFAPLLFIGCILSYTSFLTGLMHMVAQWNVLLSR